MKAALALQTRNVIDAVKEVTTVIDEVLAAW